MNLYVKFVLSIVAYWALISFVCFWPSSGHTGNYVGNFERIRAVENRPPQVANWSRTPTIIVCEDAPVTVTQIRSAVKFWEGLDYRFNKTLYKQDPTSKCTEFRITSRPQIEKYSSPARSCCMDKLTYPDINSVSKFSVHQNIAGAMVS